MENKRSPEWMRRRLRDYFGVKISKKSIIHHINKDRKDNRLENLIKLSDKEHFFLHQLIKSDHRLNCIYKISSGLTNDRFLIRFIKLARKNWRLAFTIVVQNQLEPLLNKTLSWTPKMIKKYKKELNRRKIKWTKKPY